VIVKLKHKGLQALYAGKGGKGLPPEFVPKIRRVLFALDTAASIDDLRQPGFGLHALTGDMKGKFSIVISRNWRIVFAFDGQDVTEVDYVDYH
jgi:toxin HigB-1